MFSNVERMDGWKNSEETVIVPLNERIVGTIFFGYKHTTAERVTQTTDDCSFFCQNEYSFCDINRYMLLQVMDGYN